MSATQKKSINRSKAIAPSIDSEIEIPDSLKQFEGKTARELFLGNGVSPDKLDRFAALVFGFINDIGVPIPEFAKRASKQFWKNFLGKDFNPQENIENAGVVSRLMELMSGDSNSRPQTALEKKVMPAAKPVADCLQEAARELSTVETAKFYAGRARAENIWEKIQNLNYLKMIKRASLYVILAVTWRELEKFKSQAEAERWLRDQKAIAPSIDSSEVRAVFRIIGLRYGSRRGRPKKMKTDGSISPKSVLSQTVKSVFSKI